MGLFVKKRRYKQFISNKISRKTLHKNLEFTATEQYKLIRANLDFTLPEDEKCPVIGVTSSMRGEGKSTTAINLSYVFAEKKAIPQRAEFLAQRATLSPFSSPMAS